jgi:molecular chaperone HscA
MLFDIQEPNTAIENTQEIVIGIDLGTTNSLVSYLSNGVVELIQDEDGSSLIPSVVAIKNNRFVVGKKALEEKHHIRSIKRLMGKGFIEAKEIASHLNYELIDKGGVAKVRLNHTNFAKDFTATEISSEILKYLKKLAEKQLGLPIKKAVITVPAYFDEQARKATLDAAKLAQLEVLRIISEPTAAAIAYGLDKTTEGIYAVYDFGGGTFDVSILKMKGGVFQVIATGGDALLGGDDIDIMLANHLKIPLLEAKLIKEKLSFLKEYSHITRRKFEQLVSPIINKTMQIFERTLIDSNLEKEQIKGVIMVGGSTRIPLIRQLVKDLIGITPLVDINPDEIVAIGAGIQADSLNNSANTLLLDVIPLSLGVEIMGGMVEVIIPRNTTIPTEKKQNFTTHIDNQTGISFHIVQGEREMADRCRSLARFELKGIPPMLAGLPRVEVTFTIDADGLLKVSAKELITGISQTVLVKPTFGLSDEEIEEMLISAHKNALKDVQERLFSESKFEAETLILRLKKAISNYPHFLEKNEEKAFLKQIEAINRAISKGDRDLLDIEYQKLNSLTSNFAGKIASLAVEEKIKGRRVEEV